MTGQFTICSIPGGCQPTAVTAAPGQLEEFIFNRRPACFTVRFHLFGNSAPALHSLLFFRRWKKNTSFLPIIYNYCSWSLLNTCSLNKYLLLRSWFVSFPGSHQPLPPPAAAHPAPLNAPPRPFFPLLRGAGRGPNGGKQIIYKHVPKKKKKSSDTQMPPQAEPHTIFDPMEEAFSWRSCQDQPGNTDNTLIHPLFCLIGFLYRFLV